MNPIISSRVEVNLITPAPAKNQVDIPGFEVAPGADGPLLPEGDPGITRHFLNLS